MKLYFQRSNGERRFMQMCSTEKEAMQAIHKFLEEHNFKSYYTRYWVENNELWYDVGSHTEFFILTDLIRAEDN